MHELAVSESATPELFDIPSRYFSMKHGSMLAESFLADFLSAMSSSMDHPRAAAAGQFFNLCGVLHFQKDLRFSSDAYKFYLTLWDQFRARKNVARELQEDGECLAPATLVVFVLESALQHYRVAQPDINMVVVALAMFMRNPDDGLFLRAPFVVPPLDFVFKDPNEMWSIDLMLQVLGANFASFVRPLWSTNAAPPPQSRLPNPTGTGQNNDLMVAGSSVTERL